MVRFTVPSQRVFLFEDQRPVAQGSTSIPSRPRLAGGTAALVPVGGLNCMQNGSDGSAKLYVVVNSAGVPVMVGTPPRQKAYEACTPSQAAIKAFYAWWRHTQQGKVAQSKPDAQTPIPPELYRALESLPVSESSKVQFLQEWQTVDESQLQKVLLVRLAAAGGQGAVRNYLVRYERNTKPNKLEVERKIVVNAKAEFVLPTDPRRLGTLDLEAYT